jgi:hypothetical protein
MADPNYQYKSIAPYALNPTGVSLAAQQPNYQQAAAAAAQQIAGQQQQTQARAAQAAQGREQANVQAQYGDMENQLNGQMGQLDGQQNVGQSNIDNAYREQQNSVYDQYGRAKRNYDIKTQDNTQSYSNNRNSIQTGVRAQSNALQRLLGMAGSGNSSAAREQAPYAAALQGSQQLSGAQQTYGKNGQSLDIAWGDTTASKDKNLKDLDAQKYRQENALKSTVASSRASILEKLANTRIQKSMAGGADYKTAAAGQQGARNQVNSLLAQITGLGNQYQNSVQATGPVDFKAGPLSEYQLGRRATPQMQQGGAESNIDPAFLGLLTGQKRDRNGVQI